MCETQEMQIGYNERVFMNTLDDGGKCVTFIQAGSEHPTLLPHKAP
jgi:hypothetical protein